MKRWIFFSDTHGDMCDPGTMDVVRRFCRDFKPEIRVAGGDHFDLRCLRKGASEEEEFEALDPDIEAGKAFFSWYKPTHWLRGNHDERMWEATRSRNPVLARFARKCISEEIMPAVGNLRMLPYHKRLGVLRLGHLKMIHGFHCGLLAAKHAANIYGSVLMGHGHAVDHYSIPGLEPRVGRMVGCGCQLDMDYNERQPNTLRQSHGFAYGFLFAGGTYQVQQAQEINGHWMMATEFKEYAA